MTEARNAARYEPDEMSKQWLSKLKSLVAEYAIEKGHMYVMRDLTFVTLRSKGRKAARVTRPPDPNDERRPVASAIHYFSANGAMLSPWAIVKGEEDSSQKNPAEIKVVYNENGFASRFDFMRWLTSHFDPQTRSSLKDDQWRLILVDSYQCPVKEDFFFWCREHSILCLTLPKNKRVHLDPFYWRVSDRLEEEYKKFLTLRWEQYLKRSSHEADSRKTSGIILKPLEFTYILRKMTILGRDRELAERKSEAANAWRCALSASQGTQIRDSEEPEPWNKEDVDGIFATIGQGDLGSTVVAPKLSSREEGRLTPADSADSDDEYIPPERVDSDTDFSSKRRGRSPAAMATPAKSLITRSKSAARSMASKEVSCSPQPLDRHESDGNNGISVAPRSGNHSRRSKKPPAPSNTDSCSEAAKSSPRPQIQSGTRPLSGKKHLSKSLARPSTDQTASPANSREPGQFLTPKTPKTPKKRTVSEIEDDYKRTKKQAKLLPRDEQKAFKKSLRRAKRAAIASLLETPS
ncbi:hypothetical protein N7528_001192 [Penicillium herquei]|nr:hypothetical protein N7528_001192 [Penicillium herquei]